MIAIFLAAALLPVHFERTAAVRSETVTIRNLTPRASYSLSVSVDTPAAFAQESRVDIRLSEAGRTLVEKTLHEGDPDLFSTFSVRRGPSAELRFEVHGSPRSSARYKVQVDALPVAAPVEREPNDTWQNANPIALGGTVFASGDDVPYISIGTPRRMLLENGADWYRFNFDARSPKLVYFAIDLMERDNIPADVSVWRVAGDKAVAFNDGEDPVTLPHEVQALPGNKFTTRLLREPGAYYVRVVANHPEYKLRTRVYDPTPYRDPRDAVRTAVDYIIAAGDSWHANTPRKGGIFDRVSNVHQETSLCVACHPTHFSQRAQVYAARNGYPVHFRQQLQFLAERFYNNPRPLYGFESEGAVWARVISAPANVLGRMSHLTQVYEQEITGEHRERYHSGVREFLKLYYQGREKLPPDETNGNTPLVSTYEVAWYAWEVTRDARIAALLEQDDIKNLNDLAYQTLALAAIDRAKHQAKLTRNAERLLSLQRPSGQWAMRFEPEQPEAEFATGLALWALQSAGVPASDAHVEKAIAYLMRRQQPFGGWHDPLQSYENFRTPFRETQMAVLALSSYFPVKDRAKGWGSNAPEKLASDPARLLSQLDNIWDPLTASTLKELEGIASGNNVLLRQQAVEALGRLAVPSTLPVLVARLGDDSKLVQRTAAWAVRQVYSRHPEAPASTLVDAMKSSEDRTRWGASRVFATHFAELARRAEFAAALIVLAGDPVPSVRMQAVKGLWQFWYWSPDDPVRDAIENAVLARMAVEEHPWVETNLREAVYNLADENIRYLYNNWVPSLARAEDRETVIRGRLRIEARLSEKFSEALERGPDQFRKRLLAGLTEYPLRRGDIYDLRIDSFPVTPPAYNRIGNDVEQSVFFGDSNDRFARALAPLMDSTDSELRRLAWSGSLLTRDARFSEVSRLAGPPKGEREKIVAYMLKQQPESLAVLKQYGRAPAPPKTETAAAERTTRARLPRPGEDYFRGYVQPILETRGKDGYACVHCHASHTIFTGSYGTALNVVDLEHPEQSLILRKPTSTSETEGTLGSNILSHGGGVRWEKDSPEYNTILNWIRGVKP